MAVAPERDTQLIATNVGVRTCLGCGVDLPARTAPGRPRLYCSKACGTLVRSIRGPKPQRKVRALHRRVANFGNTRALDPSETRELRRRRREGWKLEHLAVAYGVCTRTIIRYLAMPDPIPVTVAGWTAYFVISHKDRPLQVSAWQPAEQSV